MAPASSGACGLVFAMPTISIMDDARPMHGGETAGLPPDVSVIVLTHNTRDLLRACLRSIDEHTRRVRYEIIVVDNRSNDGTRELIADEFPAARYLYREDAYQFAAANNAGMQLARGRYLLLLNSDTELRNDALDRMVAFLDANREVGIAGCRLLNSDGSLQLSCRRFPGYMTALFNRYSLLTRLFPHNVYSRSYLMTDRGHDHARPVDWVSGACLFARRAAVDAVGLLDERLLFSTEDVDWCKRMWEAGWSVWYQPAAEVLHHIGQTVAKHPFRVLWMKHVSMFRYYRKHLSQSVLLLDAAVGCGLALRALTLAARTLAVRTLNR